MEAEKRQTTRWSNAQLGGLATVCLLLGLGTGYLVYSPSKKAPPAQQAPAGAAPVAKVTPEQLKRMADKKAEPLLAKLPENPKDVALLTEIGQIYFYGRQFSTSAQYYERAAKLKPDPGILDSLAATYHYAGDDKKAVEALNRALQIDPKFADALFNLGMLKWQTQSDPKAAISAWEKLLKTNPNYPRRADVETMIAGAKKHINMASAENINKAAN